MQIKVQSDSCRLYNSFSTEKLLPAYSILCAQLCWFMCSLQCCCLGFPTPILLQSPLITPKGLVQKVYGIHCHTAFVTRQWTCRQSITFSHYQHGVRFNVSYHDCESNPEFVPSVHSPWTKYVALLVISVCSGSTTTARVCRLRHLIPHIIAPCALEREHFSQICFLLI